VGSRPSGSRSRATADETVCEDGAVAALVLILTGTCALALGVARGYQAGRAAILPLLGEGEPTRTLIEASRPVYARARVRASARRAAFAVLWLLLAMYGLFLVTVGLEVIR
jgi:hypothetical protein